MTLSSNKAAMKNEEVKVYFNLLVFISTKAHSYDIKGKKRWYASLQAWVSSGW